MSEYDPKYLSAGHENHDNAGKSYLKMIREKEAELANSVLKDKEAEIAERAAKVPDLTCFIDQFPLAMAAVAAVHDYARGPLVKGNYLPSLLRHLFKRGEHPDHDAAVVWNGLARLELRERAKAAK